MMCLLAHRPGASPRSRLLPLAALFAAACTSSTPVDTAVDTDPGRLPNHLFVIHNQTGGVDNRCAAQLLELVLTPVAGGDAIRESFVLNPGDSVELDLTLLQAESFRIEVFETPDGPSMWWDSMALGIHGTTTCGIDPSALVNSWCNSMDPNGMTMSCD